MHPVPEVWNVRFSGSNFSTLTAGNCRRLNVRFGSYPLQFRHIRVSGCRKLLKGL
jgi:hypothetical protein